MKNKFPYFLFRKSFNQYIGLSLLMVAGIAHAEHREAQQGETIIFGLDPSWNDGREFEKARDGDVNTFYDYAGGDQVSYVGFDHGERAVPAEIHFTARHDFSNRMIGGSFQGSNESSTSGFESIYEISSDPSDTNQVIELSITKGYRYYRYLAPADSYGNIAEFDIVMVELSEPDGFRISEQSGLTIFGLDPGCRSLRVLPRGEIRLSHIIRKSKLKKAFGLWQVILLTGSN